MKWLIVLPLLLLCGCPVDLDTEYFAKTKPKNEELVGKYVPTAETLKWLRQEAKYSTVETSFELCKDGSFQIVNMPDAWDKRSGDEWKRQFGSLAGEWQVVRQQEWWELELSSKAGSEGGIPIVGQSPPYYVWFYAGGAKGKPMVFEKRR